ncbi:MAG: hypothetical protein MJA29_00160, partial [Candidatus Omnitrophica bacterium]|nr:hypothetical protein [Candidatus Omnitrophota bacterium]
MPTADSNFPESDLDLVDADDNEVNLILCDGRGKRNPRAFSHIETPSTAIQQASAYPSRSDRRPPNKSEQQDPWEGGGQNEFFTEDGAKFYQNL